MERLELEQKILELGHAREEGEIEKAIDGYIQLLPEAKKHWYSQVPEMIGVCYRMLDRPAEALPFAERSVHWAHEAQDKEQEANCRRDLGGIYNQLNRLDEAEAEYEKSLELLWENVESKINAVAGTLSSMAKLKAKKGSHEDAIKLGRHAIDLTALSTDLSPNDAGQHYLFCIHLAEIYIQAGQPKKARDLATDALEGTTKLGQTVRAKRAQKVIDDLNTSSS